ncbi:uncharacterized protein LOC143078890 [Mytilus galloprovincialis]|uniref:uncharacterized protein LOC143078890 n=1 Tax=Mytilus galloprovincialis TaxID=29158 RepID=UPI003F7C95E0
MELGRKLKLCVAISVLALIFKIIATASPGWMVVHTNVYFDPMNDIKPEDDGLRVDETELMKPQKERVTISFGLWYYKVCKCGGGKDDHDSSEEKDSSEEVPIEKDEVFKDDMDTEDGESKRHHHHHKKHHHGHHRCYHRSYHCDKKRNDHNSQEKDDDMKELNDDAYMIPGEFKPAAEFIKGSVDVARHARHELAWYAGVGLVLGLVGFIGAVFYARGGGMGKHPGRLACSTQILSAFFFWMVIIRVVAYYMMIKKMHHHGGDEGMLGLGMTKDLDLGCPWCPWVAAVGAIAMALASLFHMMLISRDRSNQRSEYSFHNDKIPIIAPRGYDELVFPPMYDEAGPLPEKKVIP